MISSLHLLLFSLILGVLFSSHAQEKPVLVVSGGHHSNLTCVSFSPDERYIASGGMDRLVKVYDTRLKKELNTFRSHTDQIVDVQFSSDGKHIASLTKNKVCIYTHPEGKLVQQIKINQRKLSFDFYLGKELLVFVGDQKKGVAIYDGKTGELKRQLQEAKCDQFVISPDETTLIGRCFDEEGKAGIGFFDIGEGTRRSFLPIDGMNGRAFSMTPNGKKLAFEAKMGEIGIIDVASESLEQRFPIKGAGYLQALQITPNGKKVITTSSDNFVRYWNCSSGEMNKEIKDISPSEDAYSMALGLAAIDMTRDGKRIAFAYSDLDKGHQYYTVEWFEFKDLTSIGKHQGEVKLSLELAIDPSGKILSCGTINNAIGVKCLDLVKGSQKAFIPGTAYLGSGGNYLCAVNKEDVNDPRLDIYKTPSLRKTASFDLYGFARVQLSPSGKFASAIDQKHIPEQKDPTQPQVIPYARFWDLTTKKEVANIEKTLFDMPFRCVFSRDESEAYLLYPAKFEKVNLSTGKIESTIPCKLNMDFNISLSAEGNSLIGTDYNGLYEVNLASGEKTIIMEFEADVSPMSAVFNNDYSLIAIACTVFGADQSSQIHVYDWPSKTKNCTLIGHTTHVRQLTFGPKNELLYSVDDNGIISMWDLSNCQSRASFLAFGEEDYLIISPDGYYKSSKGNMNQIGFRQNGGLYTFDQFDIRYNRPDKVLESMGLASEKQLAMYRKAYQKRLSRLGISESTVATYVHAPEISITNSLELPQKTTSNSVELSIEASDEELHIDRINVYVNDVPIYGKQGKDLRSQKKSSIKSRLTIPLSQGKNNIQVSVMNTDGIESVRESYSVDCSKTIKKPNLYIIAFGIREYKDSSMNLTYSDKDAQDLIKVFQESQLYGSVQPIIFQNNEVTKEKVAAAKSALMKSDIDDHVILFYSGHGVLDNQMDYYLSTHDLDFEQPQERGLAFESYRDILDAIPARNRLILVDACHSGEIDKEEISEESDIAMQESSSLVFKSKGFATKGKKIIGLANSFELMKELFVELRKESGATIIASSAGKEYSLESDEWKNGVFTFALKEGLIELKADSNNDKRVSVSELKRYLFERVKELTDGKQTPTVRRENLQYDFPLY